MREQEIERSKIGWFHDISFSEAEMSPSTGLPYFTINDQATHSPRMYDSFINYAFL